MEARSLVSGLEVYLFSGVFDYSIRTLVAR